MSDSGATTLDQILDAARAEFLERGFQGASLRSIVRKAGVTTGAFYGYFKSKEELLDALVGEQYDHMLELYQSVLEEFAELPPESQRSDMQTYSNAGMERMTNYIYENYSAFKLILCCADGTRYEDLSHDLARMDLEAAHDFSRTMEEAGVPVGAVDPQLEHMLVSGMFSAYFEIVRHDIPRENAGRYIEQLLAFYTAGWERIMGL